MCFPRFHNEGDIVRCEVCGQHHLARTTFREWTAISSRKARRLMRRYARERRHLDAVLSGGPYPKAGTVPESPSTVQP